MYAVETVGQRIQRLREALNLSQEELAEKVDLSVNSLARIEAGAIRPLQFLGNIADALGVTKDYIESGRDPQDEIDRFAESQFPEPNLRQKFVDYARSASFRFKNLTQEELQFLKEEFTDPEPTDRTQLDDDMECFSLPKDGNGQIL